MRITLKREGNQIMSSSNTWHLFVNDFRTLSDRNKRKVWGYVKKLKSLQEKGY